MQEKLNPQNSFRCLFELKNGIDLRSSLLKGKYLVKVKGVGFGDQVVTDGVGLLQVTDVYSTDKSEYGHGH